MDASISIRFLFHKGTKSFQPRGRVSLWKQNTKWMLKKNGRLFVVGLQSHCQKMFTQFTCAPSLVTFAFDFFFLLLFFCSFCSLSCRLFIYFFFAFLPLGTKTNGQP